MPHLGFEWAGVVSVVWAVRYGWAAIVFSGIGRTLFSNRTWGLLVGRLVPWYFTLMMWAKKLPRCFTRFATSARLLDMWPWQVVREEPMMTCAIE